MLLGMTIGCVDFLAVCAMKADTQVHGPNMGDSGVQRIRCHIYVMMLFDVIIHQGSRFALKHAILERTFTLKITNTYKNKIDKFNSLVRLINV